MKTTMDRPLLRIPCTTPTQKLLRGKLSALTPISTPSAPWFDVYWVWEKDRRDEGTHTTSHVGLTWIYIDISIFPVSNDIQQRHRIAQKHKAHFQQHLTAVAIDHIENLKDYWEKKRRSHTFPGLPVARWRKVFFTLCECWLYEYNSLWHIDKIEYFMLCSINIEGLLHNAK